jgi:hypothetical protein
MVQNIWLNCFEGIYSTRVCIAGKFYSAELLCGESEEYDILVLNISIQHLVMCNTIYSLMIKLS